MGNRWTVIALTGILLFNTIQAVGEQDPDGPGDVFVGSGQAWTAGPAQCSEATDVTLVVTQSEVGWIATMLNDGVCPGVYLTQPTSLSLVFLLDGDWEHGFTGGSPAYLSRIDIGPYENGTDIPVRVFFWQQLIHSFGFLVEGTVDDAKR